MDQRELYFDPTETFRLAFEEGQSALWTALPCIVNAFPAASGLGKMILDAQPTINGLFQNSDGTTTSKQMPLLLDCPVLWQGGGGVTATFPIQGASTAGEGVSADECLVIIASRCIDAWWQQGFKPGAAMDPPSLRMHNLSDGFAIVGLRSLPREFVVDTENACLITDDGNTYFKLNPTSKVIAMKATGGINLNGVTIDQNGNLVSPGTVTGQTQVVAGTGGAAVHLTTHEHPTAATGAPSSPTPGT